jgi:hypothetical protein
MTSTSNTTSTKVTAPLGTGFDTETGGAIYHLPRDHAMHHGDWYKGAEYQETHYFTGFLTDRRHSAMTCFLNDCVYHRRPAASICRTPSASACP